MKLLESSTPNKRIKIMSEKYELHLTIVYLLSISLNRPGAHSSNTSLTITIIKGKKKIIVETPIPVVTINLLY